MFRRPPAVALLVVVLLAGPASPASATDKMWNPAGTLPAGTAAAGGEVLSSPTGATFLYTVSGQRAGIAAFAANGSLLPAVQLPVEQQYANQTATLGATTFLPNGDAILSYYPFNTGPLRLVERFADGHFGPEYKGGFSDVSFAARSGEVLLMRSTFGSGRQQLTAQSLSLAADGTMTASGSQVVVYPGAADQFGTTYNTVGAAMDADGRADFVTVIDHVGQTSTTEVLDISRTPAGSWDAPRSLSSGLTGSVGAGPSAFVSAPGGRALLNFQSQETANKVTLYYTVREPGGAFLAPQTVGSLTGPNGALWHTPLVAAGGDGTLALASDSYTCQSAQMSEVPVASTTTVVLPVGASPVIGVVAGTQWTANHISRLMSLGAGGGQAIVGIADQNQTGGTPRGGCGSYNIVGETGNLDDRAVILGAGVSINQVFGNGVYHTAQQTGYDHLNVDAGGIDSAGNAAVLGSLATANGAELATFGLPNDGSQPPAGPGPGSGGGAGSGALPVAQGTPNHAGPANLSVPSLIPTVGPLLISGSTVTVTLTAPHFSNPSDVLGEQLTIQVFSGNGSGTAASVAAKKKVLGRATARATLKSGKSTTVRLRLKDKALRYLRAHHKAVVKLTLTSTQTGHPAKSSTQRLKLKFTRKR